MMRFSGQICRQIWFLTFQTYCSPANLNSFPAMLKVIGGSDPILSQSTAVWPAAPPLSAAIVVQYEDATLFKCSKVCALCIAFRIPPLSSFTFVNCLLGNIASSLVLVLAVFDSENFFSGMQYLKQKKITWECLEATTSHLSPKCHCTVP